jgi:hypothetical protein
LKYQFNSKLTHSSVWGLLRGKRGEGTSEV